MAILSLSHLMLENVTVPIFIKHEILIKKYKNRELYEYLKNV
jgi:hypothetical protein